MLPSRDTRHGLYEFLISMGFEINSDKKGEIREFLLKHTDQKIIELSAEVKSLNSALQERGEEIAELRKVVGPIKAKQIHSKLANKKQVAAQAESKPVVDMPAQPIRKEGAEFNMEEKSSFTMPASVKHKK